MLYRIKNLCRILLSVDFFSENDDFFYKSVESQEFNLNVI